MAFELGDIFIGNFRETQAFGARPEVYSARFNLRGHNGIDLGCPTMTPILSANDGFVSEQGFDAGGYGNYVKIVHNGYLTLYGHLNDIQVKLKDRVVRGQLIGHSDDSGFSDAPHLHFGVAPCDSAGNKTEMNNGFSGYIDPNGNRCVWKIANLKSPVTSDNQSTDPDQWCLPRQVAVDMVTKSTSHDEMCAYFGVTEIEKITPHIARDKFIPMIEEIKKRLATAEDELRKFQMPNAPTLTPPPSLGSPDGLPQITGSDFNDAYKTVEKLPEQVKTNLLSAFFVSIKNFVFAQK